MVSVGKPVARGEEARGKDRKEGSGGRRGRRQGAGAKHRDDVSLATERSWGHGGG